MVRPFVTPKNFNCSLADERDGVRAVPPWCEGVTLPLLDEDLITNLERVHGLIQGKGLKRHRGPVSMYHHIGIAAISIQAGSLRRQEGRWIPKPPYGEDPSPERPSVKSNPHVAPEFSSERTQPPRPIVTIQGPSKPTARGGHSSESPSAVGAALGPNATTPPPGNTTTPPPGNATTSPPGNMTTPPPGNATTPAPGNTTTSPPGNATTPPVGNTTTPPPTNMTTLHPGNTTTPLPGNNTTPPPTNTSTPPTTNTTTPPPGNTTTPPPGNTTTSPPGNMTTPPPGNATTPAPGNTTTSPPGNATTPPVGNTTTPPPTNMTTLPPGNTTTPLPGNNTTPPPTNTSTPPPTNTTTPSPGNMTTPPSSNTSTPSPTNTTTAPPTNTTTAPPGNTTTLPPSTAITTPAPIRFSLSFRIVNWNFNDSLLDPSTNYYKDLYSIIQSLYNKTYSCPTCPNGQNYLGFTDLRFSPGSVVTESVLRYRVSNTSINATDLEQQLRNSQNSTDGLELDSIRGAALGPNATTPPPGNATTLPPGNTTTPPPGNATILPPGNATTLPPGNATTPPPGNTTTLPPGNTTTPPPGNETTPPAGNTTTPPPTNTTTPPPGNATTSPPGNMTTPPPGNATTPSPGNTTTPPPGNNTTPPPTNTSTPPPTNTTTAPPTNTTTAPPTNTTTLPPSTAITTAAPIRFSLSFRIVNWNFSDSLLDPSTNYYKDLYSKIQSLYDKTYSCPTCPNGQNYLGFTDLRFSPGSVVTESVLLYQESDTSINATDLEQQLRNSQNSTDGLELDSIRGAALGPNATTPPPGNATTPPPGNTTTLAPGNTTTPPPGNATTPPAGNTTTPPPGNATTPPAGNTTTPPPTNMTTLPPGNPTTPPPGNTTTPPPGNTTTPPPSNATIPPAGNTTTPPLMNMTTLTPGNVTTPPPGNTTTSPPGNNTTPRPTNMSTPSPGNTTTPAHTNTTTAPLSTSIPTPAPIHFFLSFRIVNWNFNDSLLNPSTSYYKDLYSKIQSLYLNIYGCPECPNGQNYLGFTDLRFSPGSVVTESVLQYRVSDTSISATGIVQQLTQRLDSQNSFDGLELDSIRANSGSSPLATSAPAPLVPGWGIALLVLVCILLLLSILIFILLIVCSYCRRSRGKLDLFSSQASYQPMNEYPTYHTHGRFSGPGKKQNPYSDITTGNGTNAFYTNPATSDNL
ncbi:mucin-2-like [Emys orbicularis]|uniref:mucin-2-like n=1 Tax=Emys orbicularis TaxID=82168 RepID=UPI0031FBA40D